MAVHTIHPSPNLHGDASDDLLRIEVWYCGQNVSIKTYGQRGAVRGNIVVDRDELRALLKDVLKEIDGR